MDDGVTAVEAVVERETLTVSDTVETVEDAERLVVERKTADLCGTTEVFVAETMAEEVCEPAGEDEDVSAKNDSTDCVVALTERDTLVDEDEEEFWDAVESVSESESGEDVAKKRSTEALLTRFAVTTEPTDKSRGVSFPQLLHKPRLDAKFLLKSALKKPLVAVVDRRPSEDA
ncbi:hypothetical protein GN958_ATG05807 [Phytophthora infestans]|uniref:Uncharacterized protein n=1 Tax=Phytophthora infestans TaxID=4787 RepID=A0A8S9V0P7_PHYIN|nr:hypothetical protein GN958_ATG05807 [Phytophthora infestans]